MVLYTMNREYTEFAIRRLENQNISYTRSRNDQNQFVLRQTGVYGGHTPHYHSSAEPTDT